jgi:RsiW-degrading membrane proteinase PrsW (M82 family)
MKYLIGLYVVMAIMVFVTLTSEFILKGNYSAIASWLIVMLFLLGTIFFANARYYLSKK